VDGLFCLVLTNAAWATALALAATVGAWLCRRRPAIVHVLWLLVLVKLVTPSMTQVGLPAGAAVSLPPAGRSAARPEVANGEARTTSLPPGGRGAARSGEANGEGHCT
jgi:hypothetical protein